MRMLTCFHAAPPTARRKWPGFDVTENPMEVKRRIGYLPESPPVYPEMEVIEYLDFVGRIKGVPRANLKSRIDEVMQKCAVADVPPTRKSGKLSQGLPAARGIGASYLCITQTC